MPCCTSARCCRERDSSLLSSRHRVGMTTASLSSVSLPSTPSSYSDDSSGSSSDSHSISLNLHSDGDSPDREPAAAAAGAAARRRRGAALSPPLLLPPPRCLLTPSTPSSSPPLPSLPVRRRATGPAVAPQVVFSLLLPSLRGSALLLTLCAAAARTRCCAPRPRCSLPLITTATQEPPQGSAAWSAPSLSPPRLPFPRAPASRSARREATARR